MGGSIFPTVLDPRPGLRGIVRAALAVWALLLLCSPSLAQRIDIAFDRIASDDSPFVVLTALQDQDGFMWFGTQHGLYRYDGIRFVLSEPESREYQPQVPVYSLLQVVDENGNADLWIGTQRGLGRWNQQTLEYEHFRPSTAADQIDSTARARSEVRTILQDARGDLWIGRMNGGLARFSDGVMTEYLHDPDDPDSISDDEIRDLAEDSAGNLWIATGRGGLNRLGPDRDGPFERFVHDPEDPTSLSDDFARVAYIDDDDRVWVGTFRGGLNRLSEDHETFERFQPNAGEIHGFKSSRVRSMLQDQDGKLWIGTDDGLFVYSEETGHFFHYKKELTNPNSISDNRVNTIFQDASGIIWLGTQWRLSKFETSNLGAFERMWRDPRSKNTLSANTIQAFAEEEDGTLWIGTFAGLNRFDPETGQYTQFYNDPTDPTSVSNDKVGSLLVDRNGKLWIGTYEDGLNVYDPKTGTFEQIETLKPKVPCIFEDRQGVIWVATFDGGLMTIPPDGGERRYYRHDPENERSLSSDKVISVFEDSAGTLWFGTHDGGLNSFDRETETFTRYLADDDRADSLSSNGIFSISEYDGSLLIGTFGGGLNMWTKKHREAGEAIFTRDDHTPRSIYGLLLQNKVEPGQKPYLWASTDRGLWRRPAGGGAPWKRYGGAQDFNFGAYLALQGGDLLFGNDAGVLRVSPDKLEPNRHKPPILLTDFLIRNESQKFDRPVHQISEFDIDYRDAIVTFEFSALDYADPGKMNYEYRLGGRREPWIDIGNSHRATFTKLAPTKHELTVRARNSYGITTDEILLATIRVAPHPLQSNLAYAIYGLTLLAGIWWFLQAQSSKREQLERIVSERTAKLAEQNRALEELNQKFEEASYTDSLTGLRNRRYLLGTIEKDLDLVLRYYTDREYSTTEPPSEVRPDFLFLLIDLDGFKEVNDTYGHTAGDRVLEQVCALMEGACRRSDTLIRWGGDEFLIVGRYTERSAAEDLAGRIREAICEHPFEIGIGRPIRLTCSIGFSCYPFVPSKPNLLNWEQIIGIADQALYLVKEAGRNSWAGVFSTEKSHLAPGTFFTTEIHERFEQLEHEMYIDVRRPQPKRRVSGPVSV